jgi:hypothetical protein
VEQGNRYQLIGPRLWNYPNVFTGNRMGRHWLPVQNIV